LLQAEEPYKQQLNGGNWIFKNRDLILSEGGAFFAGTFWRCCCKIVLMKTVHLFGGMNGVVWQQNARNGIKHYD